MREFGNPRVPHLQLDLAVHPGFSGGPVLDDRARVLGIVSKYSEDFPGIAFALPGGQIGAVLDAVDAGLDPGPARHDLAREVVERWLEMVRSDRLVAAGELLASFYRHDQESTYADLVEEVASATSLGAELDVRLAKRYGVPHSSVRLRHVFVDEGNRGGAAIERYLTLVLRDGVGSWRESEVGPVRTRGSLADVTVRLETERGVVERTLRAVYEAGNWGIVPFLPPS